MINKKKVAAITALVLMVAGLGTWTLNELDLIGSDCSTFILKMDMSPQQKEIFEVFEDLSKCDIVNCTTGEVDEEYRDVLFTLREKDEELYNRIYYYIKNCKLSPLMMSKPNVVMS